MQESALETARDPEKNPAIDASSRRETKKKTTDNPKAMDDYILDSELRTRHSPHPPSSSYDKPLPPRDRWPMASEASMDVVDKPKIFA